MKQRQDRPKDSPTLPYPYMTVEQREQWDQMLAYFESCANTAYHKVKQIPKEARPDWYDRNVTYWRNVRSGFRWARGRNRQTLDAMNAIRDSSTETIDPVL